jgi:hypothetical protein
LFGLALAGCSEGSARGAVASAERQIAELQAEASKIAPDRLKSLTDSLEAIKARVAAGDHRSALMSARSVSSLARDLSATLPTTKGQLESAFKSASDELPGSLQSVLGRIDELGKLRRLPSTIDAQRFGALRTESAEWSSAWTQATQDFSAGNLALAMQKANDLRSKIRQARTVLGMEG